MLKAAESVVCRDRRATMETLAKEVEAIVSLIGEVNSSIQKIGAGWFSSGREMELYQMKATTLGDRLNTWSGLVHSHGLSDHRLVKPILELADSTVKCLDKEAAHLKELRHSCCMRYKSSLMHSVFPKDLRPKLKSVGTAFQTLELPSSLDEIMEATKLRQPNHLARPSRLAFSSDGRYVAIQHTVDEVVKALERKDGPQVVVLSGGAGTGKTTLVKALALNYQEKASKSSSGRVTAGDKLDGAEEKVFVNGIVYIACGNEADSKLKIVELLHSLGSYLQVAPEDNKESESHQEEVLRRRLSARLEEQEVLVILDDVGESLFLQRLLVPGKKVRYLVTTQDPGLCTGDFSRHVVIMHKPERRVAEAIFLNRDLLIDPPDTEIMQSTDVQEMVEKMIQEAEHNPLVLRNFAVAISGGSKSSAELDTGHWHLVLKKFQDLEAGQEPTAKNGMLSVYNEECQRKKVLCSFELAMESMPMEAQHLLFLAALCEGPLVPEVVLSLLHRSTSKGPLTSFSNWSNYVENRDFIKLHDTVVPWCKSQKRMWSIQSLQYMSRTAGKSEEAMNVLTESLLADNPQASPTGSGDYSFCIDDKLVASLCFVYGEKNLSAKAAIKLTIMTPNAGRGFLRLAVEPVVWLLHCDHEIEEEWEQKAYWSARGVLMTYISEGKLDDESAQTLLSIPQTASAMCKMLQIIGETGERSTLTVNTPLSMQALFKLLTRDADSTFELQRRAAETVASLADKGHKVILSEACVLDRLMRLLSKDVKSPCQAGAALALGKLAVTDDIRWKIATYPGLMPKLVELMNHENGCHVQENAAYALSRLALNSHSVARIVDFPGSLKKFSFLLSLAVNSAVQVQAAKALANLTRLEKVTHRIAVHSGIVSSAVRLIVDEDKGSGVRYQASRLLVNLTACHENHSTVCKHPSTMTAVVALLKPKSSSPTIDPTLAAVQENGAKILANLSSAKAWRAAIVGTPDALKYLFVQAANDSQPELQKHATKCLANLAAIALEADRSRAAVTAVGCSSASSSSSKVMGSSTVLVLTPEERQTLAELVSSKCSSTAGSKRHDLQCNGESGRMNNSSSSSNNRKAEGAHRWTVARAMKERWSKMVRYRLRFSSRRHTQSIRDDPTASPPPAIPVSSSRGSLSEAPLHPAPAEAVKSSHLVGEIEPSPSMKLRVTGPASFS